MTVGPQTARAAGSKSCPGKFTTDLPGYGIGAQYQIQGLKVTNTTCAVGKRVARKIPAYIKLHPIQRQGFRCTFTAHTKKNFGGYQDVTCHRNIQKLQWRIIVPSEV